MIGFATVAQFADDHPRTQAVSQAAGLTTRTAASYIG